MLLLADVHHDQTLFDQAEADVILGVSKLYCDVWAGGTWVLHVHQALAVVDVPHNAVNHICTGIVLKKQEDEDSFKRKDARKAGKSITKSVLFVNKESRKLFLSNMNVRKMLKNQRNRSVDSATWRKPSIVLFLIWSPHHEAVFSFLHTPQVAASPSPFPNLRPPERPLFDWTYGEDSGTAAIQSTPHVL